MRSRWPSLLVFLITACSSPSPPAENINVALEPSTEFALDIGQERTVVARVSGSPNTEVTWNSSNPSIASVNNGVVRGASAGTATITARSVADPSKSASVRVTVLEPPSPPPPGSGVISGTVRIALQTSLQSADLTAPFVEGEFIVKFKPQVSLQSLNRLSVLGVELQQARPLGTERTYLYRANLRRADTLAALQALQSRSDVEYAHPNYILFAQATPNDPQYPNQRWHYEAIQLPGAWDIETGASHPVTVAVIDGGVVAGHPDLAGKLLSGYDFYSNAADAGDGDGRDPNPEDTAPSTDFHGNHVTGTVGAATNNSLGVAGVSWGARILPVRALSGGSGTLADVADALRWAAGLNVPGVPANANPAGVINMSLGGPVACTNAPVLQQAINEANNAGAIIVVAAGNANVDASTFSPAGCSGVITVGATNAMGHRASYSNYGTRIDLMAPGGEPSGQQVVSTLGNGQYGGKAGTSMAAPHVAGLLALMKSKKPTLSAAEGLSILKETARPLSAAQCNRPSGLECGAGLIDAQAALARLNTPPPRSLVLSASPNALTLNTGASANVTIGISRINFSEPVDLSISGQPNGTTPSFSPASPVAGNSTTLTLPAGSTPGTYTLVVSGSASVGGQTVQGETRITLTVVQPPTTPPPAQNVQGTRIYFDAVLRESPTLSLWLDFNPVVINQTGTQAPYSRTNLSTTGLVGYRISAWKDVNNNGTQDEGDLFGWYRVNGNIATVMPDRSGVDITLEPVLSTTLTREKWLRQMGYPAREDTPR
ncbi:Extracellular basic protease [Meiothermus luteus]|uniref:Extracellular basic protease n=1 Tax=Meiothermus luteus TaxID=2026184 RepID=A0A399EH42_9DEIN|nr:S8 family peptidase [Meiothermus luteus]RIH83036.1 Extracellular basic protease [Meiothermus luteus]RMH56527.1 MAG: peptidase S8 and S53 subtilisin kexin sedolisin [Deinococcota bacterium]